MRPITAWLLLLANLMLLASAPGQTSALPAQGTSALAGDAGHGLAVFDSLCKSLEDNYPMLELVGWRNEWIEEFRERIARADHDEARFELMEELVCRLNDYHTRLSWPGRPRLTRPPVLVEPVLTRAELPPPYGIWGQVHPPLELPPLDDVAIAVVEAERSCGLQAGDEILSVDGVPVREALARAWRHSVCSSVAGKLRGAAAGMLRGEPGKPACLVIRRNSERGLETVTVIAPRGGLERALISSREVEGIPVIRISQWSNRRDEDLTARFDELLESFRERPGLILDVRGNGGGQDGLAGMIVGRFLNRPIIASISFHRLVPALTYERTVDRIMPRGPWRYAGRVAVLADEGCMSACEHFVSGMIEAGALVCGTPTSGACGWIRTVDLGDGVKLNVSETFPLHTGGIPSLQLGMAPHLWAPRRLADLRAGQDTALREAVTWLKTDKPVPVRLQPLAR